MPWFTFHPQDVTTQEGRRLESSKTESERTPLPPLAPILLAGFAVIAFIWGGGKPPREKKKPDPAQLYWY